MGIIHRTHVESEGADIKLPLGGGSQEADLTFALTSEFFGLVILEEAFVRRGRNVPRDPGFLGPSMILR